MFRPQGCDSNLDTYGFLAWVVLVLCCFDLLARLKLCRECSDLAAKKLSPELARVTVLAAADAAPLLLCSLASLVLDVDGLAAAVGSATFDLMCVVGARCASGRSVRSTPSRMHSAMSDVAFQMLAVAEIGYILTDVSLRSTRQSTWWKVQWLLPVLTYGTYVLCASTFSQRRRVAEDAAWHGDDGDRLKLEVAEEGHAWPIRPSRPTRFRRDGPAREVDPSMAAGSLGCQELWSKDGQRRHATSTVRQVAGTCCALAVLYVLFDCMGRLSCVAGASPDMMGFIVLAAGLRIPGMLEALALALDAESSDAEAEDPKLPAGSLALLVASLLKPGVQKGQTLASFEYLAILLGAQIMHLVVLLWLGRQRWVGCLLLTLYVGCLVWVLTRFYLTELLYSGRE